ncbi:hypothetical protein FIBSPDRAFT_849955 [Athelia psychrophila]|uniref:Uncharacterized protein n=1 Tax=Athelia psychrophila TaxID=1759441 RepID=A0A166TSY8_9AGAM|nr:hypothetical protein FIBSPDRAFT_849955 [Fibularhizoctonia sp. CBS 109695]
MAAKRYLKPEFRTRGRGRGSAQTKCKIPSVLESFRLLKPDHSSRKKGDDISNEHAN